MYHHLLADHAKQRALMGATLEAVGRPVEALHFMGQLQEEIAANQAAEEQTLYRDALSRGDEQGWVARSVREHDAIAQLINELTQLDPRFEAWASGLRDLAERLTGHLDSEEAAVSVYLRASVAPDRGEVLARHYLTIKSLEVELWGNAIPASERSSRADIAAAG